MKTVKVPRKSKSQAEFILRPSRWRMMIIYTVMFTLAVLAGLLIRTIFGGGTSVQAIFGDWYINLGIVVVGAVLFALVDYSRWTMRVQGGETIEGPSGAFGDRSTLSLKDINWARSGKSLRSRIKIGTGIYTNGGKRILISPWFYEPARYQEFLDQIGYQ